MFPLQGKKAGESQRDFPASAVFSNAYVPYSGVEYTELH
jgi:hypothetical protein